MSYIFQKSDNTQKRTTLRYTLGIIVHVFHNETFRLDMRAIHETLIHFLGSVHTPAILPQLSKKLLLKYQRQSF